MHNKLLIIKGKDYTAEYNKHYNRLQFIANDAHYDSSQVMSEQEFLKMQEEEAEQRKNKTPTFAQSYAESQDITEIAKEICDAIATTPKSLACLCMKNIATWPSETTIYRWIIENYQGFGDKYMRAKQLQCDFLVDSMLRIVDHPETYIDDKGIERTDVSMVKAKLDMYKWQATKLLPKKYGDKQQVENNVTITHEQSIRELE